MFLCELLKKFVSSHREEGEWQRNEDGSMPSVLFLAKGKCTQINGLASTWNVLCMAETMGAILESSR